MNQKKLFQLKNLVTTAAIALVASSVNAQTIDYGAFEELFGEPVTTSATGSPQRMSEVPLNMEIITQKDIKRTGAKTIPDVLRGYSGISVTQFTETDSEVGFRGYNVGYNDRVLVLVNGRQVFMDYYGLVAWETIPVELAEIRQIEVVKGPNTALFGFNAVSGVINILTYNPMYDDINSIEITGGTHKYRQGSAVKTIQGDKYGIRVSVGSYHMDKFNSKNTATGIGTSRQENSNKVSGSIDAIYQLGDNTQGRFEATISEADRNETRGSNNYNHDEYSTWSFKGQMLHDSDYGLVDLNVYRNKVKVPTIGTNYNEVTVVQLSDIFKYGADHTFRVMGEWRENKANVLFLDPQTAFDVYSVSGLWSWNINRKITLSNAVRYDEMNFDYKGTVFPITNFTESDYDDNNIKEISINSGLVYKYDSDNIFRLIYGRGVDIPSHLEETMQSNFGTFSLVGTPTIDASILTNYEANYEHIFRDWNDTKLKTAVFFQKTEDIHRLAPLAVFNGAPQFQFYNAGDNESTGIEIGLGGEIGDIWRWGINYSYTSIEDLNDNVNLEDSYPNHLVNTKFGFTKDAWEGDMFMNYRDNYNVLSSFSSDVVNVDSEIVMSARVTYNQADNLSWTLYGKNLNGKHNQEAIQDLEPQVFLTMSYNF